MEMTGENGVEEEKEEEEKVVDIMEEQLSEKDILKLAGIIADQYEIFAFKGLRLKTSDVRSIKKSDGTDIEKCKDAITSWQDLNFESKEKTTRRSMHELIKKLKVPWA